MGACASRAVASRADDDEGNTTATTANDGSVEDGANEFDPMDLARGRSAVETGEEETVARAPSDDRARVEVEERDGATIGAVFDRPRTV